MNISLPSGLAENVTMTIHLEVGRTTLQSQEWMQISLGDFLLLDRCMALPDEEKARVMLTINGTPLFRGRIKNGTIKILETPPYHEVEETMAQKTPGNDENDHEDFVSEFDEDEEYEDVDEDIEDEDEDEDDEDIGEESEEDIEDETNEEIEDESDEGIEEESGETSENEEGVENQQVEPETTPSSFSLADVPLTVVIEAGRIQIPLKKLIELEPGSLLDTDIHPANGVDLMVNGKLIGKGELIRIGETIGVRILDLGDK
jgi:flagellar motor switch protein FliN/FliY